MSLRALALLYCTGEMSSAMTKLEKLVNLDRRVPDTSSPERGVSYQNFYNQVRSEHDLLRSSYQEARKNLTDGNFAAAIAICQEYLSKYPGHALFQALKFDVEERQRQDLSQSYGELKRSSENAWDEVKDGFTKSYDALRDSFSKASKEF